MRRVAAGGVSFVVVDDKETFWDKLEAGAWEPETISALSAFLGEGTTLVDVGAWIGPITLIAAAKGSDVLAFEPDPRAFALLAANVAANPALSRRIRTFERAVAAEAGRLRFGSPRKPGDSMGSLVLADRVAASWEAEAMTVADVASIIADAGRLVFKVDIEGAEYALTGDLATILDDRVVAALVSFHPRILAAAGWDAAEIERRTALVESILSRLRGRRLDPAGGSGPLIPHDRNSTILFERDRQ